MNKYYAICLCNEGGIRECTKWNISKYKILFCIGANKEGIAYKISFTCNRTAEFKCKSESRMSKTKLRYL